MSSLHFLWYLKENISDNQELFESSILTNLIFDSEVTMLEEVLTSSGM